MTLLLSFALALTSYAADTGTLILSGVVLSSCNLVITPNGSNNTTLNITGGEVSKLVANSLETCNNLTGYKINLKSANAGELRNAVVPSLKTTYTLTYGGQTVTPTTNYQEVKNVTVLNAPAIATSAINATVAAYPAAMAGTYSDTVTVQIVVNP